MNYEKRSWKTIGIVPNQDGSANFNINILSGIVGDTYEFTRLDVTNVIIAGFGSKTWTEISVEIETAAIAFVASIYPNT